MVREENTSLHHQKEHPRSRVFQVIFPLQTSIAATTETLVPRETHDESLDSKTDLVYYNIAFVPGKLFN